MQYSSKLLICAFAYCFFPQLLFSQSTLPKTKAFLDASRDQMENNPDSSIYFSDLAFNTAKENQNFWAMSKSLTYSGWVKQSQGQLEEAITDYFYALKWLSRSDTIDDYSQGVLNRNIASLQYRYENYLEAVPFYDSAIFYYRRYVNNHPKIAEEYNDSYQIYESMYFKASSLRKASKLTDSRNLFDSLINNSVTPTSLKVRSYFNRGFIFNDQLKRDSAIIEFKNGLNVKDISNEDIGRAIHNIASTYFKMNETKKAEKFFKEAISIKKQQTDKRSLFISHLDLGELYMKEQNYKLALRQFQDALTVLDQKDIYKDSKFYIIYEFISQCLISEITSDSQQLFKQVSDFNEYQEVSKLEARQRAQDLIIKKFLLEKSHENEVNSIEKNTILWIVSLLVLGIGGLMSTTLYHRLKKKRKKKDINLALRKRQRNYH